MICQERRVSLEDYLHPLMFHPVGVDPLAFVGHHVVFSMSQELVLKMSYLLIESNYG